MLRFYSPLLHLGILLCTNSVFTQVDTIGASLHMETAANYEISGQFDSAVFYFDMASREFGAAQVWNRSISAGRKVVSAQISALNYQDAILRLEELLQEAGQKLPTNDPQFISILDQLGQVHFLFGNHDQALYYLIGSLQLREDLQMTIVEKEGTNYMLGQVYRVKGDLVPAKFHYEECMEGRVQKYGSQNAEVAAVLANIGILQRMAGDFELALETYKTCEEMIETGIGDVQKAKTSMLNGIAIVYAQLGQYPQALEYFLRLLEIDKQTLGVSHPDLARTYTNLGILNELMGDYKSAQDFHKKALGIKLKIVAPESATLAYDYQGLGMIYMNLGDVEQSQLYFRRALQIWLKDEGNPYLAIGNVYSNLGSGCRQEGDYEGAMEYFQMSVDIFSPNGKELPEIGPTYHNIAMLNVEMGDLRKALLYANKALAVNQRTLGKDHRFVAENYGNIGTIMQARGLNDSAYVYFEKSLQMIKSTLGEDHDQTANAYARVAKSLMLLQKYETAMTQIQKGIVTAADTFVNEDFWANPDHLDTRTPRTMANVLGVKGQILKAMSEEENVHLLKLSLETLSLALEVIDDTQMSYKSPVSVSLMREEFDPIYDEAVNVAYILFEKTGEQKYVEEAFKFSEKNRAALLVASLHESRAQSFGNIPDSLLEKEGALKRNLAYYEQEIVIARETGENDHDKLDELQSEIFKNKLDYNRLMTAFEKNYPKYFDLKYNSRVISPQGYLSKYTKEEDLLLEYFLSSESIFVFAISKQGVELHRTPIDLKFWNTMKRMRSILSNDENIPSDFLKESNRLYDYLIDPVEHLLGNKRIMVIPDDELGYLPFEILAKRNADDSGLPDYLLREHMITYAFSATFLDGVIGDKKDTGVSGFLAFAPEFGGRDENGSKVVSDLFASSDLQRGTLASLSGATEEIEQLSNLFRGKFFKGREATESRFKEFAAQFDIIHLATHAMIDDQNPSQSKLLFTLGSDSINDGDLFTWELYNMELNASLAVLSACNTGSGKVQKGEGVLSLGRAFAYAGCPSQLMSLWPAQDVSTAEIMDYFYAFLHEGYAKDEALQKAKISYLDKAPDFMSHPFYWAGFVIQGDPAPIIQKGSNRLLYGGILASVMIGLILYARARFV